LATYSHPGVYVEEVPSAIRPIAGVGTSTAGFVGAFDGPLALGRRTDVLIGAGDGAKKVFDLAEHPVDTKAANSTFRVGGQAVTGTKVTNDDARGVATVEFTDAPADGAQVRGDYTPQFDPVPAGEVHLCTTFADFTSRFGSFSTDPGQANLAHAVYGFFANGGSRCYVQREANNAAVGPSTLTRFEALDEIAIVAAPGITTKAARTAIATHCRVRTKDRFAILDVPQDLGRDPQPDLGLLTFENANNVLPQPSDYAAVYAPWLEVPDPLSDGTVWVPPSGHVAGIYARVDTERGVHKAPANEAVMGASGLRYLIGDAQQDGLNPQGVNAIRLLDGAVRVYGARTLGGDQNTEWKYVSVRRLFLYLRKSILRGTGWVVFEPNDAALWAKINRNVNAFLTNVWRDGALFGATPAEAFYVKCDEETNPQSVRDQGQVVTEIGVAVTKPAEFVIFRISQWSGPS
jgi:phage tail sheath protein FI